MTSSFGRYAAVFLCLSGGLAASCAYGQAAWKPEKNVEIIVPAGPGGGNDLTGRLIQRILQDNKLVEAPISVVNKPGGGHSVGLSYLLQRGGDGHTVMVETVTMLVNQLTGKLKVRHTDVTPLAILFKDYLAISVRADSALQTGQDFTERLKKDPTTLSIALSGALANANHLAVALVARSAGADARKLKIIMFNSGSETMTALLGGHVDVVSGPANIAARHAASGKTRVLGITSPMRLGGGLAQVPTFNELGTPGVMANWRSIIGPKDMGSAQIAFWDQALTKVTQTAEFKKEVERNLADPETLGAAAARKYWDMQYRELESILGELGLRK